MDKVAFGVETQPLRKLDTKGRVSEVPQDRALVIGRLYDHHKSMSYSTFPEALLLL